MQLEHALCNVQAYDLHAVDGAENFSGVHACSTIHDGSPMVFVKTVVYHALRTLMPYPLGINLVYEAEVSQNGRATHRYAAVFLPVGR